jgi:hypothetical protein
VFFCSPHLRVEAAWLGSYYALLGLLPDALSELAGGKLPTVARGELLCYVFEIYTLTVLYFCFLFEHGILLLTALVRCKELACRLVAAVAHDHR